MGELQGVRMSGRLRSSNNFVELEPSEESEEEWNPGSNAGTTSEESEEEWNPRRNAGTKRRGIKASAEENAVGLDAVVHRLGSVKLSKKKVKNSQVVANSVKSSYVQAGKSKSGALENSRSEKLENLQIAVPQDLVVEERAMEVIDLVSGRSDDDDDLTDDEIVEEEQEVLDRSLSSEGAALLAEVEKVLAEGGDLSKLRVDHLKAYLRYHGLRIAGVKAVLLSRIEDHLRLKDGQGERLYPRLSFRINCRGDVCISDIVLFRHTVYNNENPNGYKRHGKALGDRWVAGRIVNESYGAQKQQHTFTIEVFWSTGIRPFYIMQPIQIKGRNLYRMTTMRQPWNNEADRLKALEEKHARGAEARAQRQARVETASSSRGPSRFRPNNRSQSNNQAGAVRPPHHANPMEQPREQSQMESRQNLPHGRENLLRGTRPVPMPRDQARVESYRNTPHGWENFHSVTRPVPMARDQARVESYGKILRERENLHCLSRPVSVARDEARVESERNVPSILREVSRFQGFVPMGCSTRGCERAGALQCIVRSCGPCCYRNTLPKGSCPRHQDIR